MPARSAPRWQGIARARRTRAYDSSATADCPFCLVARGGSHVEVVYSDELVIAFLDIRPIRPGHTLVVPRAHVASFYELDDDVASALWSAVRRVARQIAERLRPEKVGLVAAGWYVPHAHIHVIPMLDYHDITSKRLLDGELVLASPEELACQASVLRDEEHDVTR
jgi:histidine triad (HIT) family protein